jgi:hypothetical protein
VSIDAAFFAIQILPGLGPAIQARVNGSFQVEAGVKFAFRLMDRFGRKLIEEFAIQRAGVMKRTSTHHGSSS